MKQTGVASVSTQSSSLAAVLRRWLTATSLRLKLYIGLGVSVCGLLIVAGVTSYTSALNQQVVNETMTRQRHLTSLVSEIGSLLLNIQNQVLEFYETWSETGFERADQGGFEEARRIYVAPVQEQIQQIRDNVAEIERLELGEQARASLTTILSSVDAYEVTLLQMSDHMEDLGFAESGELGQMQVAMDELRDRLNGPGLESFYVALLEIGGREKEFLLHSDVASAGLTQDLITQLEEQIAAADDDLLSPLEKAQLNDLLGLYRDHFLAAANRLFLVDRSQRTLIGQSDLTSFLVGNLFEQQQTELDATVEQLRERQANMTATMIGLSLLVFAISISVVYFVSGRNLCSLHNINLQRADRIGMYFSLELRVPFLDVAMIDLAMKIDPDLKIREQNGNRIEKWILRRAFESSGYLPDEILWRHKVQYTQGAGCESLGERLAEQEISYEEYQRIKDENPGAIISSREAAYYYKIFRQFHPQDSILDSIGIWRGFDFDEERQQVQGTI